MSGPAGFPNIVRSGAESSPRRIPGGGRVGPGDRTQGVDVPAGGREAVECRDVATYTSPQIGELGPFRLLTKGDELPVFAFTLHDDVTNYSVFDVSAGLRERGWQVPAYTFPADREDLAALRIVVRNGTSREMADLLLDDLAHVLPRLQQQAEPIRGTDAKGFDHATAQRKA